MNIFDQFEINEDKPPVPQWWGYIHENGSIQVKRYMENESTHNDQSIQDAKESPFVSHVYGPFEAKTRDQAIEVLKEATFLND